MDFLPGGLSLTDRAKRLKRKHKNKTTTLGTKTRNHPSTYRWMYPHSALAMRLSPGGCQEEAATGKRYSWPLAIYPTESLCKLGPLRSAKPSPWDTAHGVGSCFPSILIPSFEWPTRDKERLAVEKEPGFCGQRNKVVFGKKPTIVKRVMEETSMRTQW